MLNLVAKDIMTRNVVTIRKGSSVEEALRLMACHNVSGLPVVDSEGCLQGIITESDVLLRGQVALSDKHAVRNSLFVPHPDGIAEAYRRAQSVLVEEAMTRKVLSFMEESLVVDIAREMIEHAVNRVPIVSGCKVVGIVSRKDVVAALAREANGENLCGGGENEVRTGRLIELHSD
jgi:CBS domain-containing protein